MRYLILTSLFFMLAGADASINWQPPVVKPHKAKMKGHEEHQGHSPRKVKQFAVNNFDENAATEAYYTMPTLETKQLHVENGLITLPKTGMDNYHALVITQRGDKTVNSSVRYVYGHGKPSKTSPTKITQFQKTTLEIEPILLPREHDRYKGSKSYDFLLRFDGKPLANQDIEFSTSNGSKETLQTDENGEFTLTLPDDFKDVVMKKRGNKPAEFVLKASYVNINSGVRHTSTLAMPYHVNPSDYWNDEAAGAVVLFLGLILGLYLFRNINKKKKGKA